MAQDNSSKPTLWQVTKSVLGAFFGVQSSAVRDRDFARGNPWMYALVGFVAVVLFVCVLYIAVWMVLKYTGF